MMSTRICASIARPNVVHSLCRPSLRTISRLTKSNYTWQPKIHSNVAFTRNHSIATTEALVSRHANAKLAFETIKLGALRSKEALVEIHATGICQTDLSCMSGHIPGGFPKVFGHEGAGIVLEVGDKITNVRKGDKVLLSFDSCGDCVQCHKGHPAYCNEWTELNFGGSRLDGSHALRTCEGTPLDGHFFGQSSFARHAIVESASMVKMPADADLSLFAPLGCGMQTGAGTMLNVLKVTPGSNVAVFGMGTVGLAALLAAKLAGAKTIIAVDVNPERLAFAKELGATHGINGFDKDIVEQIQKICPPAGVEFALDGSGVTQVIETMIRSLGILGRAATVGAPAPDETVSINVWNQLIMGREYVGSNQGDSKSQTLIPYLIEQQRLGKFPIEKLIKYYDVKVFETAIADMKSGKTIKPVLRWV